MYDARPLSRRQRARRPAGGRSGRRPAATSTRSSPPAAAADPAVAAGLDELRQRVREAGTWQVGFPAAADLDWSPIAALLHGPVLTNLGAPDDDSLYSANTKPMEREVLATLASLFRATGPVRGYVAAAATEGTLWSLLQARRRHPATVVYHSTAAHEGTVGCADLLGLEAVAVAADDAGEMSYEDLRRQIRAHPNRPATVVASVGTTLSEALDDVRAIRAVVDATAPAGWVHADAALSGLPLALLDPDARPGLDFADGADSLVVSGHTFLATPAPCAVVLARTEPPGPDSYVNPIDAPEATIGGSRSGAAPLMLWYVLRRLGVEGLRRRATAARSLAGYTHRRLTELGWTAYRANPLGFTVVLKSPPPQVARKWQLPSQDGWSHIVVMPGTTRIKIDALLADLAAATGASIPLIAPFTPTDRSRRRRGPR